MNAASGADGEDPEGEAAAVIEGMGDGEVIDLEALPSVMRRQQQTFFGGPRL